MFGIIRGRLTKRVIKYVSVNTELETYLGERISLLNQLLETVNRMAENDELPDVSISNDGLKISPLTNSVPKEADHLMQQAYSLLLRIKITDLLMEVDSWTGFTDYAKLSWLQAWHIRDVLQYLSPLAWEHINLTGDYVWEQNKQPKKGKYRPLRPFSMP